MVLTIVADIVIAKHHIDILAALVLDEKVREGGAVWDELPRSAGPRNYGLTILTCALIPGAEMVYRPSASGFGASHPGPIAAASATAATKRRESLISTYTDWFGDVPKARTQVGTKKLGLPLLLPVPGRMVTFYTPLSFSARQLCARSYPSPWILWFAYSPDTTPD
jgi:hypothetical protein